MFRRNREIIEPVTAAAANAVVESTLEAVRRQGSYLGELILSGFSMDSYEVQRAQAAHDQVARQLIEERNQ